MVLARILALAVPLSLLTAFLLARHIARPLRLLQERTRQVRAAAVDRPVEVRTGDEIEELNRDFNLIKTGKKGFKNVSPAKGRFA